MTPLLRRFLKLPATTSLVKIEQRQEAQKIQEVYDVTEKVSHTEEVEERGEVAPLDETVVLLAEVKEKENQRVEKSELRGDISVTDTARKETRLTKLKVLPKSAAVVVDESDITRLKEEPRKSEEVISVRMIESPTEEIPDERRGVVQVSKHETSVSVRRERERTIKTESKVREVREQEVKKERELVKDVSLMTETDETRPFPIIISTGARKQTETVEIERKDLTEESIDQDVWVISAVPEGTAGRTKEFTHKTTKVLPAQEKMVEEDTVRQEETHLKPTEDQSTAQRKVPVKVHEAAPKLTSEKEDGAVVKPKESVTDIELKKSKVIEVAAESGGLQKKKKREESRSEDTVQTKASGKTRTSRGTQRNVCVVLSSNQQGSSFPSVSSCFVPRHLHITRLFKISSFFS